MLIAEPESLKAVLYMATPLSSATSIVPTVAYRLSRRPDAERRDAGEQVLPRQQPQAGRSDERPTACTEQDVPKVRT